MDLAPPERREPPPVVRPSNPEIERAPGPTALSLSDPHARHGGFMVLMGPSGRGRTSPPRAVAGFVEPRRGDVRLNGRDVAGRPLRRRKIGIVFQSYALFPHRLALDNAGFGLECRKVRKADAIARSRRALDLVDLGAFAERRPKQLSGGQPRRVALARAMPDR